MGDMLPLFAKFFSTHSEVSAAASVTLGAITGMALGVGKAGLDLRIAGGLGGVASSEPSFAMWDLSRMVRSSDELSNEMDKGAENFKQELEMIEAEEFKSALKDFITKYGSRGPNEWELRSRTWETHPELVFSIIDAMRNADDSHDPRKRHSEAQSKSKEALKNFRLRLPEMKRPQEHLKSLLRQALFFIPAREQTKRVLSKSSMKSA